MGAIQGKLTEKQKNKLAKDFKCARMNRKRPYKEDEDQIFFRELEIKSLKDFRFTYNVDGENNQEAE